MALKFLKLSYRRAEETTVGNSDEFAVVGLHRSSFYSGSSPTTHITLAMIPRSGTVIGNQAFTGETQVSEISGPELQCI